MSSKTEAETALAAALAISDTELCTKSTNSFPTSSGVDGGIRIIEERPQPMVANYYNTIPIRRELGIVLNNDVCVLISSYIPDYDRFYMDLVDTIVCKHGKIVLDKKDDIVRTDSEVEIAVKVAYNAEMGFTMEPYFVSHYLMYHAIEGNRMAIATLHFVTQADAFDALMLCTQESTGRAFDLVYGRFNIGNHPRIRESAAEHANIDVFERFFIDTEVNLLTYAMDACVELGNQTKFRRLIDLCKTAQMGMRPTFATYAAKFDDVTTFEYVIGKIDSVRKDYHFFDNEVLPYMGSKIAKHYHEYIGTKEVSIVSIYNLSRMDIKAELMKQVGERKITVNEQFHDKKRREKRDHDLIMRALLDANTGGHFAFVDSMLYKRPDLTLTYDEFSNSGIARHAPEVAVRLLNTCRKIVTEEFFVNMMYDHLLAHVLPDGKTFGEKHHNYYHSKHYERVHVITDPDNRPYMAIHRPANIDAKVYQCVFYIYTPPNVYTSQELPRTLVPSPLRDLYKALRPIVMRW